MKGLQLYSLRGELVKVERKFAKNPAASIADATEKLGDYQRRLSNYFWEDEKFSFPEDCNRLPLKAFRGFSFDELCKIYYSSSIMMDGSVNRFFETAACYEVVRKISNSMWRWGYGRGTWNEVVQAYDCIRLFSFGLDGFEVRLDYTTHCNERGYSKYSRTFLDGVFAYLIYYEGKHVMTISFSIQEKRHLLIQQVQLKVRKGNRWLSQLPVNRLESVIELFRKSFPGYRLWLIDGESLVKDIFVQYRDALNWAEEGKHSEEVSLIRDKVKHLETDRNRLVAFYSNIGSLAFRDSNKVNGLLYREVVFEPSLVKVNAV